MQTKTMPRKLNKLYRVTIILLALLLTVPNLVLEHAHALPGSGTAQDPYRISTRTDLVEFLDSSSNFSGQHVVLTTDIVVNSMNADRTIFNTRNKVNPKSDFKGTFDGRGYEIIGLDIKGADGAVLTSAEEEVGLFKRLSGNAVVKNVRVSGTVAGGYKGGLGWSGSDGKKIGGIVGRMQDSATVQGSSFVGTVQTESDGEYIGGIAGEFAGGTIENCDVGGGSSRNALIIGKNYIGGIAGSQSGTIIGCTFSGSVEALDKDAGGITGNALSGKIESASVNATIKGKTEVGGIAGNTANNFLITHCEVKQASSVEGTATGLTNTMAGGVAGQHAGRICNSVNSGYVKGRREIGGIAGRITGSSVISNSLNKGTVEVTSQNGGGIAGNANSKNSIVQKNVNLGTITGGGSNKGSIGGFARTTVGDNLKWNFYRYYPGAPNAFTGSNADYGLAYDWAGAPVGSNQSSQAAYAHFTWIGLVVESPDNYLNKDTGSPCGGNAFYLDPANNWLPMVDLSGDGQPAMPAIVRLAPGKHYALPSNPWSLSELPITGDSAFSASYEFLFDIGAAPASLSLRLDQGGEAVSFPIGTSVIVATEGEYYYHNVSQESDKLLLGDFYKMGTEANYAGPQSSGSESAYLVIFDFSGVDSDDWLQAGTYDVRFLPPQAMRLGEGVKVQVVSKQLFEFDYLNPVNGFRIKLNAIPEVATGYDHQVGEKPIGLEFFLTDGIEGARWPLPVGTTINGIPVAAEVPYHILPISLTSHTEYTILLPPDISNDNLFANGIAYAAEDPMRPRGGHTLKEDVGLIEFVAPEVYALKTSIPFMNRFLDRKDTAQTVTVGFEHLGSNTSLQTTLQRKVDGVYVDVPGHVNKPVFLQVNATAFGLTVPAGAQMGTYRFLIALHDASGQKRAQSIENIIIK